MVLWRHKRRRGLSTVVTTMMLVSAVAVMGSAIVAWSNSNFAIQRLNIANATDTKINLIRENFMIEDVWFYTAGPKYANVTLRNTGDVAITFSHIYINNSQVWNAGLTVLPDGVGEVKIQTNWDPGKTQSIWVKTYRGSEIKQVWKS